MKIDAQTRRWWTGLRLISCLNLALWGGLFFTGAATPTQLTLSGIYVAVCAFRSFLPRIGLERVVLVDHWLSSIFLGRSLATVAEMAFTAQLAILLVALAPLSSEPALLEQISGGLLPLIAVAALALPAAAQSFVNFETPHVHPMDMTPDGTTLLLVNTADNRLEVFDVSGAAVLHVDSIPVGLDPVSVRARSDTEAWVANQLSDSVSVVDLPTGRVRATLDTDDEPADVVFAGTTERAFVSFSQANTVMVFDPADLSLELYQRSMHILELFEEDLRRAPEHIVSLTASFFESCWKL